MRIGILETGKVNPALVGEHGDYPAMMVDWLGPVDPGFAFETWSVVDGAIPKSPADADAWLITGSKSGVYDPEPWIAPLGAFLRGARAGGVPIVGVCFGHQILAEAFGGRAEKSDRGWGVGVQDYDVTARPSWMGDAAERIAFHAMHQDQVTRLPEDATVLAGNAFCPIAAVAYGDPERPDAISIQPHPEYRPDYAKALVELRRDLIGAETADPALETYGRAVDNDAFGRWVAAYLAAARARRNAA